MDFSLLQANARIRLLRNITALRPVWIYYLIMVVDPILRFSWIFFAIFTHDSQHSTIVSFMVSLAEVIRRGLWTLLRVENEHCANVAQYKASRDTPLPYLLEEFIQRPSLEAAAAAAAAAAASATTSTRPIAMSISTGPSGGGTSSLRPSAPERTATIRSSHHRTSPMPTPLSEGAVELASHAPSPVAASAPSLTLEEGGGGGLRPANSFRRHRSDTLGRKSILQAMAEAHKQDFVKKRPPVEEARDVSPVEADDEEEVMRSEEEGEDDDLDDEGGLVEVEESEESGDEEDKGRVREALRGGRGEGRGGLRGG
jgi:hypothetical protein